jgi:hypothetical protein
MKPLLLKHVDFLGKENFIYKDIPRRMTWMNPFSYDNLLSMTDEVRVVISDLYRSPASSAEAYARKTGVAKPGYSGHNYGISVDFDIDQMLKINHMTYDQLCRFLEQYNCWQFQGRKPTSEKYKRGKEDWHFNIIPENYSNLKGSAMASTWIENNIKFDSSITGIQQMLKSLKFYQGAIDGLSGPLMREAIKKFKKAWLPSTFWTTSDLDALTIRTINIVSCEVVDIDTGIEI